VDSSSTTSISNTVTSTNYITSITTSTSYQETSEYDVEKGDINKDDKITVKDLTLIKRIIIDDSKLIIKDLKRTLYASDLNNDGIINAVDLVLLIQFILNS